jgi:hypothetical protein
VYEAPRGDIGRDGRQGIQACAKLRRHWAPITAVVLAVVFVVAALYAHRHPWLDPGSASEWKHDLALAGAALALAGSLFQGVKSHGRARFARTRATAELDKEVRSANDEDARFFYVGILWWIVSAGALLALLGEILDM